MHKVARYKIILVRICGNAISIIVALTPYIPEPLEICCRVENGHENILTALGLQYLVLHKYGIVEGPCNANFA